MSTLRKLLEDFKNSMKCAEQCSSDAFFKRDDAEESQWHHGAMSGYQNAIARLSAELPKWGRLLEAANDVAQFNEPKDASDAKALARLRAALKEVQE